MKQFLYCTCILILNSCNSSPGIAPATNIDAFKQTLAVDIMTVANKTPAEVEKLFGKPTKIVKNPKDDADLKNCNLEMQFKKGSITVLFNSNRAAWFEFDHLDTLQWRNKPEIFGLKNMTPTESTDTYDHYKGDPAFKNIAFIQNKQHLDMIDYAIV